MLFSLSQLEHSEIVININEYFCKYLKFHFPRKNWVEIAGSSSIMHGVISLQYLSILPMMMLLIVVCIFIDFFILSFPWKTASKTATEFPIIFQSRYRLLITNNESQRASAHRNLYTFSTYIYHVFNYRNSCTIVLHYKWNFFPLNYGKSIIWNVSRAISCQPWIFFFFSKLNAKLRKSCILSM